MIYTVIFTRKDKHEGLVSWIDSNQFDEEEKAYNHAIKMCHEWWDEDPTIMFTIYKHAMLWKSQAR